MQIKKKTPRWFCNALKNASQILSLRKQTKKHQVQPSRWWPSGKSLGPRGLLPLWSQVQALWLLI